MTGRAAADSSASGNRLPLIALPLDPSSTELASLNTAASRSCLSAGSWTCSASSSGRSASGVISSPGSLADSSSTGFWTISWVTISFSSSRLSWRMVTIWTSPGVRICFCATFSCSLGDSKLICLLFYHRIYALPGPNTWLPLQFGGHFGRIALVAAARLNIHPPYPRADAANNVVGDGPRHLGELLRVQRAFALRAQQRDFIARAQRRGVAEIDGREVHRNGAQDGSEFAVGDHLPAIRQPVKYAIRVPRPENADTHGARRAEAAAIAHQRPFGNFLHRQ